ncbi:MAG: hypothetical protein HY791_11935 [Deltaproteobacteria bacterium]|nr:hypothetical protein [Deltaproteobacteria bacterium]
MSEQRVFILRGRAGTNGNVFGLHLFRPEAGTVREVPLEKLHSSSYADEAGLFRAAHDYAREHGFAAAFPTFLGKDPTSIALVLLRSEIVQQHDVLRRELGGSLEDLADLFIAVRDYANEHTFRGGYPTMHRLGSGPDARYRVLLFPGPGIVSNSEMAVEPGWRPWDSVAMSYRRAHEFALERGFLSGLPTFNHKDNGDEIGQSEKDLNELLTDGWRVLSITPMASAPAMRLRSPARQRDRKAEAPQFFSAAVVLLER